MARLRRGRIERARQAPVAADLDAVLVWNEENVRYRDRAEATMPWVSDWETIPIGHGVGCGSNEPPYIGEAFPGAATAALEAGVVFAVEPLIWLPDVPGGGGVRLEDMVAVTPRGARRISRSPYCAALLA